MQQDLQSTDRFECPHQAADGFEAIGMFRGAGTSPPGLATVRAIEPARASKLNKPNVYSICDQPLS